MINTSPAMAYHQNYCHHHSHAGGSEDGDIGQSGTTQIYGPSFEASPPPTRLGKVHPRRYINNNTHHQEQIRQAHYA